MRRRLLPLAAAGVLISGGLAAAPLTASAQGPVITGGLVNVTISNVNVNVLNHSPITVTIPIQAAANICGTTVAVLSPVAAGAPGFTCTASPSQGTTVSVSPPA